MASKPPSPISAAPPLSNRYNVAAGAGSKQVTVAPVNRYQIGGCGPGEQAKKQIYDKLEEEKKEKERKH